MIYFLFVHLSKLKILTMYYIGRLIPTTPWEAPFRGIASWLGIKENHMVEVCPNLLNFNSTYLIEVDEMFVELPPSPAPSSTPTEDSSGHPSNSSTRPSIATSSSPSKVESSAPSATLLPSISPSNAPSTPMPSVEPSVTQSDIPSPIPSVTIRPRPKSVPTVTPSVEPEQECIDSSNKFKVTRPNGGTHFKFCRWVKAKNTFTRCLFDGVSKNCPKTCGTCYSMSPTTQPSIQPSPLRECIDSPLRFQTRLPSKQFIWRTCTWVKAKNTIDRCAFQGVSTLCAKTCGTCNVCQDSALKIRFKKDRGWVTSKCQWRDAEDLNHCDTIDGWEDACRKSCNKCWTTGQM